MRDRISIKKDRIPYRADLVIGTGVYRMEMHYNSRADCFVVHLYKGEELVCAGEKLVYGRPLWRDMYQPGSYPVLRVVPFDESGQVGRVTRETFGTQVFLTVEDGGETDGAG